MTDQAQESAEKYLTPRKDLYEIFSQESLSVKKKTKIIEALDEIDGYDLVFIIGLVLETRLTGCLNIISEENEISGINFFEGTITHIDLPDKETYFGNLLMQEGLVKKVDLDRAIKQKDMQMGQFLISQKILTVQQISSVILLQMRLRLSKLISNKKFQLNFVEAASVSSGIKITQTEYFDLCHDWISGRFEQDWLNYHFIPWEKKIIKFNENKDYQSKIFAKPLFTNLVGLADNLKGVTSIYELKKKYGDNKLMLLKAIHFLSISALLSFSEEQMVNTNESNKLELLYINLKSKTDEDLAKALSLITKIKEGNTESIYIEFLRILEIDLNEKELVYKNELTKIALQFLAKSGMLKKKDSTKALKKNDAEIQNIIKTVQIDLFNNNYYEAFIVLKKLYEGNEFGQKVKLFLLWAKIGQALKSKVKANLKSLEDELVSVLPEDKETAEYFYVCALFGKLKNDKKILQHNYEKAVKKNKMYQVYPVEDESIMTKILGFLGVG
ncbi:MAG: hypothetical protein WA160_16875 [Pseudobdellovibrio sp.]